MKKIILLILTTFIGLFAFSFNVKALNSDATATCVYTIPNNGAFKNATFKYTNVDLSKTCSVKSDGLFQNYDCKINTDITKDYFVDRKTGTLKCPTLYYSYRQIVSGGTIPTTSHSFEISWKEIETSLVADLTSFSSKGALTLSTSQINQGTKPISDTDKSKYLQCICGGILIKQGSLTFQDPVFDSYQKSYKWTNFNLSSFKECPEGVYYKVTSANIFDPSKSILTISDVQFDKSQAAACATTEDAAGWNGSSGNDTDYKPQEDVIGSFCSETAGAWKVFGYLVMALKIMVPAIIIVMGSLDLGKAVVANSEDEMKKATQILIKRVIAGIVIFFIPTIINLVLKLASNYVSVVDSGSSCIQCVSTPGSC